MGTADKMGVLKTIAAAFEKSDITWAVGASALLCLKGIVPDFRDIDLVVAESDTDKVKAALDDFGTLQPENPDNRNKARVYFEYVIDGVEVDIMAGLIFISDDRRYEFSLKEADIQDFAWVDDVRIPLQSLGAWKQYYALMNRSEKVLLIDEKERKEGGG